MLDSRPPPHLVLSATVSVIMPTLVSAARRNLIFRAIDSILAQGYGVVPIVVANGDRFDALTLARLKARRDIRFIYRKKGCVASARLAGRQAVDTEFFTTLDDDDELLPDALATRLRYMHEDPSVDAVITNGYRRSGDSEAIDYADFAAFAADPLQQLMETCWLQPAGGLFRTETVTPDIFDTPGRLEWTYLALRLALEYKLRFVDVPTYRMHRGSPGSLSARPSFLEPEAFQRMLALNLPPPIRRRLRQKHADCLHTLSDVARADGDRRTAWRYHLRSLCSPYGLRYLPVTRKLLRRSHNALALAR